MCELFEAKRQESHVFAASAHHLLLVGCLEHKPDYL